MTPRMRNLYDRCCAHDGGVTGSFMKQTDKWLLAHLKRQGWVVTWPDDHGVVRVKVVRFPKGSGGRPGLAARSAEIARLIERKRRE